MYADDNQDYIGFKPIQRVADMTIERVNAVLCTVENWLQENKLKVNGEKTEYMLIGMKGQLKKITAPNLVVSGHIIKPSTSIRNLGAYQDETLSMKVHVANVTKSANFQLHNLCKIRKCLDEETTKIVVHQLITSRLDYTNSLLCNVPDTTIKPLQKVQNSAARLVTGARKFDHISPVLKTLHWLPVKYRVMFKVLLMTYKALNGLAPEYLSDMLTLYSPVRCLRSAAEPMKLEVPRTKLVTAGDRAFKAAAPHLWNSLPVSIRTEKNIESFKKHLKTHLFRIAFYN